MADITYLGGGTRNSGAPALPASRATTVHCLMIPLSSDILLLPNTAVAEVAGYQQPQTIIGAPDWYLGTTLWRDYQIPVIAFEVLNGDVSGDVTVNKDSRVAVLNTLNGNKHLPYIGMLTQGIPRLQVVQNKALEANPAADDRQNAYVAEFVMVNGEPITIPNIDKLESAILDLSL